LADLSASNYSYVFEIRLFLINQVYFAAPAHALAAYLAI
jgi:hypothetical protein